MNGNRIKQMLGVGFLTLALTGLLALSVAAPRPTWGAFELPPPAQRQASVQGALQGTAAAHWDAEHHCIEDLALAHGNSAAEARAIADAVMLVRYPGVGLGR